MTDTAAGTQLDQMLAAAYAATKDRPAPPLEELIARQAEWDRQDQERSRLAESTLRERYLGELGFPVENRNPSWPRLPEDFQEPVRCYCDSLQERVQEREGLFLGSAVGGGKTSAFSLVALRAREIGLRCAYVLAGWALVDACQHDPHPYGDAEVLILDDLDYVSTSGYEGEARSWDTIGRYLYRHYAGGGAVCVGSNLPMRELCEREGLYRVVSRWEQRLPGRFRLETDAGDQRRQPEA